MVNLAGKAIRWEPFGHCVGIEKRPIDSLRRSTQHTVEPDDVCGHDYFASRCVCDALRLSRARTFRLARTVEGDRLANERLEGGLVNFFSFVDVDRAAYVSVETRVEETGRILQRRALGEGELHDILVGFASADDAVVRPNRSAHPLPLLDDVRVCFLDELAHSAEGFPAPIPEFGDSFRDELRCRLAVARARLFHVLLLPRFNASGRWAADLGSQRRTAFRTRRSAAASRRTLSPRDQPGGRWEFR